MENENKDNRINNMANMMNNKCIENHIADMLEHVLYDENKSEIDISLINENQVEDFNQQRNKLYFKNGNSNEYNQKHLKNPCIKSNTFNEKYQKPEIYINAPEEKEYMNGNLNIMNNNVMINQNNFGNNLNINNNMLKKKNSIQTTYLNQGIPNINNLSPINKNIMKNNNINNLNNNPREDEFMLNKFQKNRLHINYVNPNQNQCFSIKGNNINNSPTPENNPSPRMNNNYNFNSVSPRGSFDNNPSPRQYNISVGDYNNFSTSQNR